MKRTHLLLLSCAAALSAGVVACGSPDKQAAVVPATAASQLPSNLVAYVVQNNDIARYPSGSASRAFMEFWRNLQFANSRQAYDALSRQLKAKTSYADFRVLLRNAASGLLIKPESLTEQPVGANALQLNALLAAFAKGVPVSVLPRGFRMVKEGTRWAVDDVGFVEEKSAETTAARAAASKARK